MIISIENHCDFQNQRKMADVFGSKRELCKDNDLPNGRLPSPEQLKGKIILKGTYSEVQVKVENCMDLDNVCGLYEGIK